MENVTTNIISSFRGEYRFLSNFHPCEIIFNNLVFPSVEHAYVASKTFDSNIHRKIQQIPSAGKVKRLGKTLKIRPDFDDKKVIFMADFLIQKFKIPTMRQSLVDTGDISIIEGNIWHDNFWGICICDRCQMIEGKNMLGKLLMRIRHYKNRSI